MPSKTRVATATLNIKAFAKEIVIPFSFILPILILYVCKTNTFQDVWKGRAPYLIFLWLFFLELALALKKLPKNKHDASKWLRIISTTATLAVPTVYVLAVFLFGLNHGIIELGKLVRVPYEKYGPWFLEESWPLSFEYIFFFVFFTASILLAYKIEGLKRFSVSLFFLGATGSFYMIDTLYPYGTATALQGFVPFIASATAFLLGSVGYEARWLGVDGTFPILLVTRENSLPFAVAIYWPCAGVTSLFIYTFVILLFLKDAPFSVQRKTIQAAIPKRLKFMARSKRISFLLERRTIHAAIMAAEKLMVNVLRMVPIYIIVVVGAIGTFIVNILRIAAICIMGVNVGSQAARSFHNYYGELFFIAWIIIYLTIIIYGRNIWTKLSIMGAKLKKLDEEP